MDQRPFSPVAVAAGDGLLSIGEVNVKGLSLTAAANIIAVRVMTIFLCTIYILFYPFRPLLLLLLLHLYVAIFNIKFQTCCHQLEYRTHINISLTEEPATNNAFAQSLVFWHVIHRVRKSSTAGSRDAGAA